MSQFRRVFCALLAAAMLATPASLQGQTKATAPKSAVPKVVFKDVKLNDVNYDARGPRGMEVIGGQKVGWVEGNVI